jgi:hypothetical protein
MQATVSDNSVTRTLALAARTLGGQERLAEFLGVGEELLQQWLDAKREPPTSIYVRALELVALGPFAAPHRARERAKKKS